MKKTVLTAVMAIAILTLASCGGNDEKQSAAQSDVKSMVEETPQTTTVEESTSTPQESIDISKPTLDNKGIGPVSSVELSDEIDTELAEKGKEIYKANCTACHKIKKKYIGPALKGVTQRRSPEWIMNMVLNTTEMLEKDPVAKALINEFNAPMAQQTLTEEEVRAILEYLRLKDSE